MNPKSIQQEKNIFEKLEEFVQGYVYHSEKNGFSWITRFQNKSWSHFFYKKNYKTSKSPELWDRDKNPRFFLKFQVIFIDLFSNPPNRKTIFFIKDSQSQKRKIFTWKMVSRTFSTFPSLKDPEFFNDWQFVKPHF